MFVFEMTISEMAQNIWIRKICTSTLFGITWTLFIQLCKILYLICISKGAFTLSSSSKLYLKNNIYINVYQAFEFNDLQVGRDTLIGNGFSNCHFDDQS